MNNTEYTKTTNGALQYHDVNKCLTLFSKIGGLRNATRNRVVEMFEEAFNENPELATQISYWVRAAREGSGERNTFYLILDEIAKCSPAFVSDNARTLAELGYYKDLIRYFHIPGVVSAFTQSIREKNRLACKWAPRKGDNAKLLRDELGFTNREYRKWLKRYSETVEQQMSNHEWEDVNYSSVPGTAMRRYGKSFESHDEKRFTEWKEDTDSKASTSASYPHEVMKTAISGDDKLAQKQWDSLPDLIKEGENILPMIDVSGSMTGIPMHVAISLGLYLSVKNKGKFNSKYLTFSENPKLGQVPTGTLSDIYRKMMRDDWGRNTDFEKAYNLILDLAMKFNVPQENMPTMLLVLSDMQFDRSYGGKKPHLEQIRILFEESGYTMPKLVFWNLDGQHSGSPAMPSDNNVGMVSGFSPVIMRSVLSVEDFTPISIMNKALENIILNYDNLPDKLDIVKDTPTYDYDEYGWK